MLNPHPQRIALHNEVHARPYEQMTAPLMLSHLALLTPQGDAAKGAFRALGRVIRAAFGRPAAVCTG